MRIAAFALVSLLVACNPSAPSGDAGTGAFPDMAGASYRAEATVYGEDGETMPTVMIRSGNKVRMEIGSDDGTMAIVSDGDTGDSFVLMTRDGQTMAMAVGEGTYDNPIADWNAEFGSDATRTGACSIAGETGAEWTRVEGDTTSTACVTDDGIILRATENERVTWETTSIQRGPQAASQFVLPEGVQTLDLGGLIPGANTGNAANANAQVCAAMRSANAPADALARAGC